MGKITVNFDFKPRRNKMYRSNARLSHKHLGLLGACLVYASIFMAFVSNEAAAIRSPLTSAKSTWLLSPPQIAAMPAGSALDQKQQAEVSIRKETYVFNAGDTLSGLFAKINIGSHTLARILQDKNATSLKRPIVGQYFEVFYNADNGIKKINYFLDALNLVEITPSADSFQITRITREPEVRIAKTAGVIDGSLFASGQRAGLSDSNVMALAKIFDWDIDFALDIRDNDRFAVVYEERYLDGKKLENGTILAAEFINQGKVYRAVRYTDKNGNSDYYAPNGQGLRKAFIRTPVEFAHISSGFGVRHHPILNKMRAHKGVDYSAPTGTPIRAAGSGMVEFIGNKAGYGKAVVIRHQGGYKTLYAHMSKFNKTLHVGARVDQGQVIGRVGSTGLATGPHLHYEFLVNGVHRNPLTVSLPNSAPVSSRFKGDFLDRSKILMTRLNEAGARLVANNSDVAQPARN